MKIMQSFKFISLLFHLLIYDFLFTKGDDPILMVKGLGRLRGSFMDSSSGQRILAYRGIPYARPPVNESRFTDPVPVDPWTSERDATRDGPCCIQSASETKDASTVESEDCLYLNVYTKHDAKEWPVMFFIHGGMWTHGCGNSQFYGPQYLLDENVVLVTINYRLGIFGFISTEDDVAPGNYGLLDQNLALKWVRNHISSFGGDPSAVTIFGESAGGYSVSHHVLSPLSSGLFRSAICQSGTSLNPRAIIEGTFETLKRHAKLLGYMAPPTDARQLLNFLRSQPAQLLIDTQSQLNAFLKTPIPYGARIDKERMDPFLPDDPLEIFERGDFPKIPQIIGVNKDEGAYTCGALMANNQTKLRMMQDNYRSLLPGMLEFHYTSVDPAAVADIVWNHYVDPGITGKELYGNLTAMIGDRLYYGGFIKQVDTMTEAGADSLYLYQLSERPTVNSVDLAFGITQDLGVAHSDDLLFLFSIPKRPLFSLGSKDHSMSRLLVTLFTSFAKTSVPAVASTGDWLPTEDGKRRYFDLKPFPEVVDAPLPFEKRLSFWRGLPLDE